MADEPLTGEVVTAPDPKDRDALDAYVAAGLMNNVPQNRMAAELGVGTATVHRAAVRVRTRWATDVRGLELVRAEQVEWLKQAREIAMKDADAKQMIAATNAITKLLGLDRTPFTSAMTAFDKQEVRAAFHDADDATGLCDRHPDCLTCFRSTMTCGECGEPDCDSCRITSAREYPDCLGQASDGEHECAADSGCHFCTLSGLPDAGGEAARQWDNGSPFDRTLETPDIGMMKAMTALAGL